MSPISPADQAIVGAQLRRLPRGIVDVAWRCPCGKPGVVTTAPRLPDGTPFPTTYYLTCPRAVAGCSSLEANGAMAQMTQRLNSDPELAERYRRAHDRYLAERAELGDVPELAGISAGGMPSRVKCLHVLVAHALAAGAGVNPLGDEALAELGEFWAEPCLPDAPARVGVIDCGTNSVRLLIAQANAAGGLAEVTRDLRLTRLGQGVDATGEFHPDALERTFAAVDDYARQLAEFGAARVRFVATSAARDAGNRDEFFAGIRQRLGVAAEVIPGTEEARLSFVGALAGLPPSRVSSPVLVVDIGGGSTELVVGDAAALQRAVSLDIGSVRLRERFLHSDPPTADEVAAARACVDELLDSAGVDFGGVRTLIGVGGTATSLSALVLGLPEYDRTLVHGSVLDTAEVVGLAERLLAAPVAEVADLPTMHPKRADVICAGALICAAVASRVDVPLTVSETDILDGLALDLLADPGSAPAPRFGRELVDGSAAVPRVGA